MKLNILYGGHSDESDLSVKAFEYIKPIFDSLHRNNKIYLDKVIFVAKNGEVISQSEHLLFKYSSLFHFLDSVDTEDFGITYFCGYGIGIEDGSYASLFEYHGLPTTANIDTDRLFMDKYKTYKKFPALCIPSWECYSLKELKQVLSYNHIRDFVLKPIKSGSSFGVSKNNFNDTIYEQNVEVLMHKYGKFLVQPLISGDEIYVSRIKYKGSILIEAFRVLINNKIGEFLTNEVKTSKNFSRSFEAINKSEPIYKKLLELSDFNIPTTYRADFLSVDNDIKLLEVNTMPGMFSDNSAIPKAIIMNNITMEEYIYDVLRNKYQSTL
jgi:D-alanine-D-alanine ligase-like ATP-grasp enzyme